MLAVQNDASGQMCQLNFTAGFVDLERKKKKKNESLARDIREDILVLCAHLLTTLSTEIHGLVKS